MSEVKSHTNKDETWWEKLELSYKLSILAGIVFGPTIIIWLILIAISGISFLNEKGDISGWSSFLISTAVGIYVTFAILIYSDISQKQTTQLLDTMSSQQTKIEGLVNKIDTMTEWQNKFTLEQANSKKEREARSRNLLQLELERLKNSIKNIIQIRDNNAGLGIEKIRQKHEMYTELADYQKRNLSDLAKMFGSDLDRDQIRLIPEIRQLVDDFVKATPQGAHNWNGSSLMSFIEQTLMSIPEYADRERKKAKLGGVSNIQYDCKNCGASILHTNPEQINGKWVTKCEKCGYENQ